MRRAKRCQPPNLGERIREIAGAGLAWASIVGPAWSAAAAAQAQAAADAVGALADASQAWADAVGSAFVGWAMAQAQADADFGITGAIAGATAGKAAAAAGSIYTAAVSKAAGDLTRALNAVQTGFVDAATAASLKATKATTISAWLGQKAQGLWDTAKGVVSAISKSYDTISMAIHTALSVGGMVPGWGVIPDAADLALTTIEIPFGKSDGKDFGLAAVGVFATVAPGTVDVAAAGAKIGTRMAKTGAKVTDGVGAATRTLSEAGKRGPQLGEGATLLGGLLGAACDYWAFGRGIQATKAAAWAKAEGFGYEIGRVSRFENARNAVVIGRDKLRNGEENVIELAEIIQHGRDKATGEAERFLRKHSRSGLSPDRINELFQIERF